VQAGWVEALQAAGQKVIPYNTGDRISFYDGAFIEVKPGMLRKALDKDQAIQLAVNGLLSACYKTWPDVVLIVSGFFLEPEMLDLLRDRGHRVVLLCTEQPYELNRELELAAHCDFTVLNDPANLDTFKAQGPATYLPHAYRPSVHYPGPPSPELRCDLGFVGTGYPSRLAFFEQMDLTGIDVLLAGNWSQVTEDSPLRGFIGHDPNECLDNARTAQVYRSAKLGLNLYRRDATDPGQETGIAVGPREIEMAATECFFLRDPRPEGDELFPMLPTFDTPEQASEQLRWWLGRDDAREKAAKLARRAVAERTFDNNVKRLLDLLE
jgi:spore maturation protein CgeB